MAETKLDLKGVIQVDDGDGWTSTPRDYKKIFEPFMNAIKAIRAEYPDHYIGLTYGANADQSSKLFTTQYGFTDTTTPSKADIDTTKLDKVNIPDMLKIMAGGSGQAAVLSNPDVINMFTTNGINKFIIIPFDTMDSTVDKHGNGNIDGYGHKTDCIEFAKKFLALPKSIIIGWRNGKSLQSKITNNTERQNIVPGMDMLYFALGGGVAALTDPKLNHTTKDYIDFLIKNWDSESQKFIESKIASVPDLKKKPDDKKVGTGTDGADAEKKPAGVNADQIKELQDKLEGVKLSDADGEKKTAYRIAQEIFNAFFGGSDDKSKQTKEFLTNRVKELQGLTTTFGTDKQLAEIAKRLENPAAAATSTVGRKHLTKPVVTPEKKYVFAFDIDDTLVRLGVLITTNTGRITPFNAATHAADHDAMLKLMNDMIVANHYVWIVTANSNISKDNFQKNYLTGEIGKKIIASENYYFMNPTTVDTDLKGHFISGQISPHLTAAALDLDFSKTDSGYEFQTKGLKPYAMIAKWLQLKNSDMSNVQMYLFDDNEKYGLTCKNVKDNKIEFVKISPPPPAPVAPPSPPPVAPPSPPAPSPSSGFKSDVLEKATEKFNAISKTTTPPAISGGGNLKVMTFNTWYEAFSPAKYDRTKYCTEGDNNKCTDTIMKTIVDRMKEGGPQVIFLQEFTSRFDDFFGKVEGVVITKPDSFASTTKVQTTNDSGTRVDTDIPQLRHFTMTAGGKKFYVYTATIAGETITTIYSSDLCDKPADAFFIGNTAIVRKAPLPLDNAPYFWKDKTDTADEESWIFGGARPYIVLEFKDMKLVLINLHSHHDVSFRPKEGGPAFTDEQNSFIGKFKKEDGSTNSVQTYAFSVLGTMLKNDTRIPNLNDYSIIIGGDFNAEPKRTLELLNLSLGSSAKKFTDDGIDRTKAGYTCCTTDDGVTFNKSGDQIYSRGLKIVDESYKVHEVDTLEKRTGKSTQNYFSDHLPVYATITLPSIAPIASGGP
jgi:hypothetical protein